MAIIDKTSGFGKLASITQSFDDVTMKFIGLSAVNNSSSTLRINLLSPIIWKVALKAGEKLDYSFSLATRPAYSIKSVNKADSRVVDTIVGYEIKFTLGD